MTRIMTLGSSPYDGDPRVAVVKQEYEAFNQSPDGIRVEEASANRITFRALPEDLKDRAHDLSHRLHLARKLVRDERARQHDEAVAALANALTVTEHTAGGALFGDPPEPEETLGH